MEIEIIDSRPGRGSTKLTSLSPSSSISDVKTSYQRVMQHIQILIKECSCMKKRGLTKDIISPPAVIALSGFAFRSGLLCAAEPALYPDRQAYKLEPRGRTVKDSDTLHGLGLGQGGRLYLKDLGPQVGWATVFLTEYAGPLLIYLLFYSRPALIYGPEAASAPRHLAVQVSCVCWTFHYGKRLLETIFVHRFSHGTMPIMNIFKNSAYYWGFAAFVAYFNNHPLYTPPSYGLTQLYAGLVCFLLCELGNFSIHVALRNLRPPGSKERRIPRATSNPLTALFSLVSCPNYTYEAGAWFSYSVLAQSLPALLFALVGFGQMTLWALGKHKNYRAEFKDYPRGRTAIIPFLL